MSANVRRHQLSFTALFAGIVFSAPTGQDKQDPGQTDVQNAAALAAGQAGGSGNRATPIAQYNPPGNTALPKPDYMRVLGYKTQADCDGKKHAPLEADPGAQQLGPNTCTNLLTWSTVIRQSKEPHTRPNDPCWPVHAFSPVI